MKKHLKTQSKKTVLFSRVGIAILCFLLITLGLASLPFNTSTQAKELSLTNQTVTDIKLVAEHPPGTTVAGSVDYVDTLWGTTYEVSTPGIYKIRVDAHAVNNQYGQPLYFEVDGTGDIYAPAFDANTSGETMLDWFSFSLSTGTSDTYEGYFLILNPGIISVRGYSFIIMGISYPGTEFSFDVVVDLHQSMATTDALSLGSQDRTWNTASAWHLYTLGITEEDFYNVTIEWEYDYDTLVSGFQYLADPSYLVDVEHGTNVMWDWFYLEDWIPAGTGVSMGMYQSILPLAPQTYLWYTRTGNFTLWGGSYIDLTITISRLNAPTINISSPGSFTVTDTDFSKYAFLEFDPQYLYTITLERIAGDEWQIGSNIGLELEYSTSTITTEWSLHEVFVAYYPDGYGRFSSMQGNSYSQTRWWARRQMTVDGIPVSGDDYMSATEHPGGKLPLDIYAWWLGGYTPTFEFTISMTRTPIPLLNVTTPSPAPQPIRSPMYGTTVPINTTIGPFYYVYRVAAQSGYKNLVKATASDYDGTGYSSVSLIQPTNVENWLSSLGAQPWGEGNWATTNGTAGLEFVSAVTEEVYIMVSGAPGLPSGYNTEELTVELEEFAPTSYTPNTMVTIQPNRIETFSFPVTEGYAYLIHLHLSDPQGVLAFGTVFNEIGNSPFDITQSELIFMAIAGVPISTSSTFSSIAFVDYQGGYIANETGIVTLLVMGSNEPLTLFIQVWEPEGAGFNAGFTLAHWVGAAIIIPVTFILTWLALRRWRQR
ncbi:MAG: hypothetical protein ACFFCH_10305 [Promethearchaeota archaeon]